MKIFNSRMIKGVLIAIATLPLMACAGQYKHHKEGKISDYSFAIGPDGIPIVKSRDGRKQLKPIPLTKGKSIKATSIEEFQTITIIRAKGSDFFIIEIAGKPYRFDMIH